ncbi:hypothetical protein NQ318_009928 [Aromia moschata]|uniref:HMG box domain-containing protein n=1 Tax=Aromia moschata TaxID=1265417 RepID=A0AAV8XWD0_9CUCU|nr:hypothetical protein NQ318_009928 [Aromia moschata]
MKTSKKSLTGPFRSGRITRNPFLNFMRDFRKSNNGLKLTELTKRGAELWRKMNERQKSPYCQLAKQAPRRRRRRKSSKRRRRRRRAYSYARCRSASNRRAKFKREDRLKDDDYDDCDENDALD